MNAQSNAVATEIEREITQLLQGEHILVLGTCALGGGVMVHGMHFVSEGMTVYVSSLRSTRKLINIQKDPRVAFAVWRLAASHADRHEARNLQMRAHAEIVTDEAERQRLAELMEQKQPWFKGSPEMRTNRWVRLKPIEAMWQQGAEEVDARRILRFSPDAHVSEVFRYPDFVRQNYASGG